MAIDSVHRLYCELRRSAINHLRKYHDFMSSLLGCAVAWTALSMSLFGQAGLLPRASQQTRLGRLFHVLLRLD